MDEKTCHFCQIMVPHVSLSSATWQCSQEDQYVGMEWSRAAVDPWWTCGLSKKSSFVFVRLVGAVCHHSVIEPKLTASIHARPMHKQLLIHFIVPFLGRKNRGSLDKSISVKFCLSFLKMILGKVCPPLGYISAAKELKPTAATAGGSRLRCHLGRA